MNIADGTPESHPGSGATPLPYDPALSPGVGPPTAIQPGQLTGPTIPGRDTTGEYQSFMAEQEADCRAAQATGQNARNAMLAHYAQDILPVGAAYGDPMVLPPVPDNAVPPAMSDLYPWAGLEPTPAGAPYYHGNEPLPE
jgi:hypothetical protein